MTPPCNTPTEQTLDRIGEWQVAELAADPANPAFKLFAATAKNQFAPYAATRFDPTGFKRIENEFLGQIQLHAFRGCRMYGLRDRADTLICLNATAFSHGPRKNAWGRYLNFYLTYTLPLHRATGAATALHLWVEQTARAEGYNRLKSLVGSWAGLRLHMGLGHHYWGVNAHGQLIIDSPLDPAEDFPSFSPTDVPAGIRQFQKEGPPGQILHLLSEAELTAIATYPAYPYAVSPAEAQAALAAHPLPALNSRGSIRGNRHA